MSTWTDDMLMIFAAVLVRNGVGQHPFFLQINENFSRMGFFERYNAEGPLKCAARNVAERAITGKRMCVTLQQPATFKAHVYLLQDGV